MKEWVQADITNRFPGVAKFAFGPRSNEFPIHMICYLHHPYPEVDGSLVHISSLENPAFYDRFSVSHSAFKFFTFFFFWRY